MYSYKNIKNGIRKNISNDVIEYLNKHQLIEKYFSNFTNFNTNSFSFKESFNTYNNLNRSNLLNAASPLGINRIENILRKNSLDFVEDNHSIISHSDIFNNNFMLSYGTLDNNNNDILEDLISSNQMSTNFYSRNIKNSFDKFT